MGSLTRRRTRAISRIPGPPGIPSEKSPSGPTPRMPPSIERIKSKFRKITGVNVFETSDKVYTGCSKTFLTRLALIWRETIWSYGDPSRRPTISYCGPLTALRSAKCGRRNGTHRESTK